MAKYHRIAFNEGKLLDAYDRMMDEMYLQHHVHPSNIKPMNLSAREIAEMDMMDQTGRILSMQSGAVGRSQSTLGWGAPGGPANDDIYDAWAYRQRHGYRAAVNTGQGMADSRAFGCGIVAGILLIMAACIFMFFYAM